MPEKPRDLSSPSSEDHLVPELEAAVAAWDRRDWPRPRALVVSGSGLAVDLFPPLRDPVPLQELLPFPLRAVEGHEHRCELLAPLPGRPVLYLRGRLHGYQGYTPPQVVFAVRLAALLGARVLLMTNAAGGTRPDQRPGQLTLITDHLNLTGANPLRGEPPAEWGPRFPDLTSAYDPGLRLLARSTAAELAIELADGVYAGLAGPSYETPAEVRAVRTLGADLVGMSTVHEVIAARHLGMRCLCFSLVSNLGAGVSEHPLDHSEVMTAGKRAAAEITRLLRSLLSRPELIPDHALS